MFFWKYLLEKAFSENRFPFSPGKRENGRYGEKGKRNRMPGKGKRQSSKFELTGQVLADGMLSEILPDGKTVEDVMADVDLDGSGAISFDEFRKYLRTQESVIKWSDATPAKDVLQAVTAAIGRGKAEAFVFSNFYSNFWLISNFWQTLRGSLSAVSTPKLRSKY